MENELEKLVENVVKRTTKPLEAEIKELKTKLYKLVEGLYFVSDKHYKMTNEYEEKEIK